MGPLDSEMVEQADDVEPHLCPVRVRIVRLVAGAMPAQIETDDAVVPREIRRDAGRDEMPVERAGEPMEKDDRLSRAAVDVVNASVP